LISPSLQQKINKARAKAPSEVPIARLCADLVFASMEDETTIPETLAKLKQQHGSFWSVVTAFQFMSGRRGEFAAEAAPPSEQSRLLAAHAVAKHVCEQAALGASSTAVSPSAIAAAKDYLAKQALPPATTP